jgi:hypothetical protein
MAYEIQDRVKETSTTTGTGTLTLAGAVFGFRTFSSVMVTGDVTTYCIVDLSTGAWEIGNGTLASSTTLTRDQLLASSTGSFLTLTSGTKEVFMTIAVEMIDDTVGQGWALSSGYALY